jgi:hypothetical protein
MSSWLSWVDCIYISFFTFHCPHDFMSWSYLYFLLYFIVLMTSWVDRIYISFCISLSSWLSWVDRIYISFLHFIVLMTSWVDRIYISFFCSLSSWLPWVDRIYIPFTFHCPHDSHELIVFIPYCPYDIF